MAGTLLADRSPSLKGAPSPVCNPRALQVMTAVILKTQGYEKHPVHMGILALTVPHVAGSRVLHLTGLSVPDAGSGCVRVPGLVGHSSRWVPSSCIYFQLVPQVFPISPWGRAQCYIAEGGCNCTTSPPLDLLLDYLEVE